MDNWTISVLAMLGSVALLGGAMFTYWKVKRGAYLSRAWLVWLGLGVLAIAAILASLALDLSSGPAEAIFTFFLASVLVGVLATPLMFRRIRRSELNRVIAKDL